MHVRWRVFLAAAITVLVVGSAVAKGAEYPFQFRDVGEQTGLLPSAAGIRGHAAAWGDIDNDGWPDLFVGTFHDGESKPSMLLRNDQGHFRLDDQAHLQTSGSGSGALLVDLTNDGHLDLFVANCVNRKDGPRSNPSRLFWNDGDGQFTDVSEQSGTCPEGYAGRGLAALDFDGDGLLDLVTTEQYYSPNVERGAVLYRNRGDMRFEDVTKKVGLPVGLGGLGVAAADVNNDGWPDIFLTHGGGEHRLFLNDGQGKFREAAGTRDVFRWQLSNGEDVPAGVVIADVNRDQLADIVIGHHFSSPWASPAPIRLYLNRGIKDGVPKYEDITDAAGLGPLAMKAPHVEIQDFDNDGWPDIYVSIVKFKKGRPYPVIYRNLGRQGGVPRFRDDAWDVNDFPTAEDTAIRGGGAFFEKVLKDQKIIYMAPGPSADFNRDGKLDLFLANWWVESPSLLLKNETPGGNWLQVQVEGKASGQAERGQVNRMGIGAKVKVYPAGKLGQDDAILANREICVGYGYCAGQEAFAHIGLGDVENVDLVVELPHAAGMLERRNVSTNQRLIVKQE